MNNNFVESKTEQYFNSLIKCGYFCGFPNTTREENKMAPKWFISIHGIFCNVMNVVMLILIALEWAALLSQQELSEKQRTNLVIFCTSHPILFIFVMSISVNRKLFKELVYQLTDLQRRVHSDEEFKMQVIRQMKLYSRIVAGLISSALISYGLDGLMMVIRNGSTFTTIITCWPNVHDKSWVASIARVVIYMLWWCFMLRATYSYVYVISLTVCLSYQYKNLVNYFRRLNSIFEDNNLSQLEKERKFFNDFKAGLMLHSETLSCTVKTEKACTYVYGGEIIVNVSVLVLLMAQMVNLERTISSVLPIVTTGVSLLLTTGFFMCTAGDVTVEAAEIPVAMFESGWQFCVKGGVPIRALLVVAITQGQKPVVMKTLGLVDLSYQSYVSIVKSTYSLFSVLY